MPNYRRDRDGLTWFFTVVTRHRAPVFAREDARAVLRDALGELRRIRPFSIDAWVLLPDHIHCIWSLPEGDRNYSMRWGWLKKEVTKRLGGETVWQRRFWEHCIRGEADFAAHCDYIHYNPVKHGHVRHVADWPWSTFHRFVAEGRYPANWAGAGIVLPDRIGNE